MQLCYKNNDNRKDNILQTCDENNLNDKNSNNDIGGGDIKILVIYVMNVMTIMSLVSSEVVVVISM